MAANAKSANARAIILVPAIMSFTEMNSLAECPLPPASSPQGAMR